jgi:hypothetical protein
MVSVTLWRLCQGGLELLMVRQYEAEGVEDEVMRHGQGYVVEGYSVSWQIRDLLWCGRVAMMA